MQLIRKLGTKVNKNGILVSWAEFICEIQGCGKIVERPLSDGKKQKSCGCIKKEVAIKNGKDSSKHGGSYTKIYGVWVGMKKRCYYEKHISYKYYGAREITICDEWLNKEIGFINWALNNGYKEGLQIDRINNNGNYESNNCRWVTASENQKNKGDKHFLDRLINDINEVTF